MKEMLDLETDQILPPGAPTSPFVLAMAQPQSQVHIAPLRIQVRIAPPAWLALPDIGVDPNGRRQERTPEMACSVHEVALARSQLETCC